MGGGGERETMITQNIPIIVLSVPEVSGLHEPVLPQPDVHILLPSLSAIKTVSDRFTRLASPSSSSSTTSFTPSSTTRDGFGAGFGGSTQKAGGGAGASGGRLKLSATAFGDFRIALDTPGLKIQSLWSGLQMPALDPGQVEGGEDGVATHASTVFRERAERVKSKRSGGRSIQVVRADGGGGEEGGGEAEEEEEEGEVDVQGRLWASVNVEGKDWSRVLSVGRMEGSRVVCCVCDGVGAVMYVYPPEGPGDGEEVGGGTVLTYYIASYSA